MLNKITEEAAYAVGAKGAAPTEDERKLFEAWMRGHCWAVSGTWDGTTYVGSAENGNYIDPHVMNTRQLWAAWRDRGSLTAPACLHQIQEPEADIWPCVNIDVDESGKITNAKLYSPGLPAGNHDVYPVRVPYMDEHTEAWLACAAELRKHLPEFMHLRDMNGIECAVAAIRELAERSAPVLAAPAAVAVLDERAAFETAYATEWSKNRSGNESVEQLAAEIKGWREGETYPDDMPYLKNTWDGYQWAHAALAATPAAAESREELAQRLIGEVKTADAIATAICQRVAELGDRNSPEDWPKAMLVTGDELHLIAREAVIEAQETSPAAAPVALTEQDDCLLNQSIEFLNALSNDERNRGNCSSAEAAAASAYAVQRLAALLATGGQAQAVLTGELIEAVDAWFARNTGLGGCSDKDVAELAAIFAAPQAQADARDAAFEAVRKAFCKLQRYSFFLDDKGNVRRTADYCGNWVEFEAVHTLFEPAAVDAAIAAAKGE